MCQVEEQTHRASKSLRQAMLDLTRVTEEAAIRASSLHGLHIGRNKSRSPGEEGELPSPAFTKVLTKGVKEILAERMLHSIRLSSSESVPLDIFDLDRTFTNAGPEQPQGSTTAAGVSGIGAVGTSAQPEGGGSAGGLAAQEVENKPVGLGGVSGAAVRLAISPVDGVPALLSGRHGGSCSLVVGASEGVLAWPTQQKHDESLEIPKQQTKKDREEGKVSTKLLVPGLPRYFVVVLANSEKEAFESAIPDGIVEPESRRRFERCEALKAAFRNVQKSLLNRNSFRLPTLATTSPLNALGYVALGPSIGRVREFEGSPVAAVLGLGNSSNNIDGFYGVVRRSTAMLIAAAAKCSGLYFAAVAAEYYCLPDAENSSTRKRKTASSSNWDKSPSDSGGQAFCPAGARLLTTDDFITSSDLCLIATGVTPHPVLDGVSISSDGTITTDTLVLNGASRTSRRLMHTRDYHHDTFMHGKSEGIPIKQAIEDVLKKFRNKDQNQTAKT